MFIELDIINIFVAATAVANILYGLVIYSRNRKSATNFSFFLLTLSVSAWGVAMLLYRSAHSVDQAVLFARILYIAAATIPVVFFFFVKTFPESVFPPFLKKGWYVLLPYAAIVVVSSMPFLVRTVEFVSQGENTIVFDPIIHLLYGVHIVGYFGIAYIELLRRYFKSSGLEKAQIGYIFLGTFIATSISVVTNLIMLLFGNYSLNWLGQISTVVMISSISYAILKLHLFNIQVIITEVFMVGIWIALFSKIFVAETVADKVFDIGLFVLVVVAGVLLIRSVIREVETRQRIEKLAKELEQANTRLKELDRQKSEFVSIASHQLRSPITAIRGYISLILEKEFGDYPETLKEPLSRIAESARLMIKSIEDYLNISRIEQGRMKYEMSNFDIADLANTVVGEYLPIAEKKGLDLTFSSPGKLLVTADVGKIKQVIANLVDNSIKYTPTGNITVKATSFEGKVRITVSDTGVGLAKEDIGDLFNKFIRARGANKINTSGTGLGLYVAKQMIEAHKGRVWAESDGKGKGSRFIIELSAASKEQSESA